MKVVQLLPTLVLGDAVSNNCRAIDKILKEAGYETAIYAENIDQRLPQGVVSHISAMPHLQDTDILLYHFSTGTPLNSRLAGFGGRLVIQYHNITPPEFFTPYDKGSEALCRRGLEEMRALAKLPALCLADSEFNGQNLREAGYVCPIHTVPILVPFEDYDQAPDEHVVAKYRDDYVNFLFVGRIAPNKKQEDVIKAFAWYQKHINERCRLFIVGNDGMTSYVNRLKQFVRAVEAKNVIFPGHIRFNEILAYYRVADVFLCMSEHEGFCVPLLEAMHFDVPIVARNTTAIPYTLGGSGVLLESNVPMEAALAVDRLMTDENFRNQVVASQRARLADFSYQKVKARLLQELHPVMK